MARKTKDLLNETALRLFTERGIAEVSTRDIADAMGVQVSTLYRHMKSKEDLVSRIFGEAYHQLAQRLKEAISHEDELWDQIDAVVSTAYEAYEEDPDLIRFLLTRQHDVLGQIEKTGDTPVDVVFDLCARGVEEQIFDTEYSIATAAALMTGMILQPLIFTHYGTLPGPVRRNAYSVKRAIRGALGRKA